MRLITFSLAIVSLLWLNTASATVHPLTNCKQVRDPNAVLMVHASWCPHCKTFLPVYKAVSDLPEMQKYTFYIRRDDRAAPVCNTKIRGFPTIFAHGMENKIVGEVSRDSLISFIEG